MSRTLTEPTSTPDPIQKWANFQGLTQAKLPNTGKPGFNLVLNGRLNPDTLETNIRTALADVKLNLRGRYLTFIQGTFPKSNEPIPENSPLITEPNILITYPLHADLTAVLEEMRTIAHSILDPEKNQNHETPLYIKALENLIKALCHLIAQNVERMEKIPFIPTRINKKGETEHAVSMREIRKAVHETQALIERKKAKKEDADLILGIKLGFFKYKSLRAIPLKERSQLKRLLRQVNEEAEKLLNEIVEEIQDKQIKYQGQDPSLDGELVEVNIRSEITGESTFELLHDMLTDWKTPLSQKNLKIPGQGRIERLQKYNEENGIAILRYLLLFIHSHPAMIAAEEQFPKILETVLGAISQDEEARDEERTHLNETIHRLEKKLRPKQQRLDEIITIMNELEKQFQAAESDEFDPGDYEEEDEPSTRTWEMILPDSSPEEIWDEIETEKADLEEECDTIKETLENERLNLEAISFKKIRIGVTPDGDIGQSLSTKQYRTAEARPITINDELEQVIGEQHLLLEPQCKRLKEPTSEAKKMLRKPDKKLGENMRDTIGFRFVTTDITTADLDGDNGGAYRQWMVKCLEVITVPFKLKRVSKKEDLKRGTYYIDESKLDGTNTAESKGYRCGKLYMMTKDGIEIEIQLTPFDQWEKINSSTDPKSDENFNVRKLVTLAEHFFIKSIYPRLYEVIRGLQRTMDKLEN